MMGEPSVIDRIREWVGSIAFDIYLWSMRMTAEQYHALVHFNCIEKDDE